MKTSVVMVRSELSEQRTKDSFFNATLTLKKWNSDHPTKLMTEYFRIKSTNEFVEQLKSEGIETPFEMSKKGTWMHPKLYIDFCMWISVEFKSQVIDWVLDGLIKSRTDAGDYYNQMTAAILETYVDYYHCKPAPHIYIEEANLVKSLVAVKDRNKMTEIELKQITYLQKVNTNLIRKRIGKQSRIKRLIEASEILI